VFLQNLVNAYNFGSNQGKIINFWVLTYKLKTHIIP